jgi:tetratricopeptide (TPR) repeat protein
MTPPADETRAAAEKTNPAAIDTRPTGEVTPPAGMDSDSSAEAPGAAAKEAAPSAPEAVAPQPAGAEVPRPAVDEVRVRILQARAEGRWSMALELCHRALERDPEDEFARRTASEIETAAQERDVEQLCGLALSYAADGEVELAARIAEKVERLAPWSPKYLQLQVYLDEEAAKRAHREVQPPGQEPPAVPASTEAPPAVTPPAAAPPAVTRGEVESLTSAALNHFVRSEHGQARQAVEKALALDPRDRKARELLKILGTIP